MRFYSWMKPSQRVFRTATLLLVLAMLTLCAGGAAPAAHSSKYLVYVGTYTEQGSATKGIYAYRFDAGTGEVTRLGPEAETVNPSFLAVHPNGRFLYAVNE